MMPRFRFPAFPTASYFGVLVGVLSLIDPYLAQLALVLSAIAVAAWLGRTPAFGRLNDGPGSYVPWSPWAVGVIAVAVTWVVFLGATLLPVGLRAAAVGGSIGLLGWIDRHYGRWGGAGTP